MTASRSTGYHIAVASIPDHGAVLYSHAEPVSGFEKHSGPWLVEFTISLEFLHLCWCCVGTIIDSVEVTLTFLDLPHHAPKTRMKFLDCEPSVCYSSLTRNHGAENPVLIQSTNRGGHKRSQLEVVRMTVSALQAEGTITIN